MANKSLMFQAEIIEIPKTPGSPLPFSLPKRYDTNLPAFDIKPLKKMQKINTIIASFTTLTILILAYFSNELNFQGDDEIIYVDFIRIIIFILCLFLDILILQYYTIRFRIKKSYQEIHPETPIWEDKNTFKWLIIELIISSIVVPPYQHLSIDFEQLGRTQTLSTDDIIIGFMFLKVYHFIKVSYEFAEVNSIMANFYCRLHNTQANVIFIMKSFIVKKALITFLISFSGLALIGGFLLRVYERTIDGALLSHVSNGIWASVTTQTTVGYGDIYPLSHLGRVVNFVSCICGCFFLSYIVITVHQFIELNNDEERLSGKLYYQNILRNKLKDQAALIIFYSWRLAKKRRESQPRINDVFNFYITAKRFKLKRRSLQAAQQGTLEDMIKELSLVAEHRKRQVISYIRPLSFFKQQSYAVAKNQRKIFQRILLFRSSLSPVDNSQASSQGIKSNISNRRSSINVPLAIKRKAAMKKVRSRQKIQLGLADHIVAGSPAVLDSVVTPSSRFSHSRRSSELDTLL